MSVPDLSHYELIAIDLDGTLLGPDGKVSERNKAAVRKALDVGIKIVFATGRNWYESAAVLDEVGHHGAAVFVGGAITIDTNKKVTLHRQAMEPRLAIEIIELFESHGLTPLVLQDREQAGVDFLYGRGGRPEAVAKWHDVHRLRVREVENFDEVNHTHTMRVSTLGPPQLVDAAEAALSAKFAERVFAYKVHLANYGVELLEAFDPSVNKWAGIERVAADLGISADRIIAIGDDNNDLHMVKHAGLGVAMGNARDTLKAVADRVIGSHAEDGLAVFLEEMVGRKELRS